MNFCNKKYIKIVDIICVYNFSSINNTKVFLKYTGGMEPRDSNNGGLRNTIDIYKSVI